MSVTFGVGSSAPNQPTQLNPIPVRVGSNPVRVTGTGVPGYPAGSVLDSSQNACEQDVVDIEYHTIAYPGGNGFVDQVIQLNKPRTTFILTVAGSVNSAPLVFLSLRPTNIDPNGGLPILVNGDVQAIPFPTQAAGVMMNGMIKFCSPVSQIFITAQAQGGPGESITIACTNDIETIHAGN